MCPICITTAVLIAGGVTSTGGLSAIALKRLGGKSAIESNTSTTPEQFQSKSEG